MYIRKDKRAENEWTKGSTLSYKSGKLGYSLVVQWLGLHAFTAKGASTILDWELRADKLHGEAKNQKTKQS